MKNVYTDTAAEYRALRTGAGLLEHEDAGLLSVTGAGAAAFLGEVSTRSVAFLLEGQSSSALLLTDDGRVLAELLVHCRADGYLVEVWHAQAKAAKDRLLTAAATNQDVAVADVSARYAVFGVEGPESFRIVDRYLSFPISSVAYRSLVTATWEAGTELLISRTGLTGEYGYKLYVPAAQADTLRAELTAAGAVPAGLDALDICRMEMRFVNIEREGGDAPVTPFELGLQWMVDLNQEFTGRDALVQKRPDTSLVCWVADPDTSTPESGRPLTVGGVTVGMVAHAVYSPGLGRAIGTGRVERRVGASGLDFELGDTGRAVRTVSAPFLVATSFGVAMD
jgi:aminomethyltransferase